MTIVGFCRSNCYSWHRASERCFQLSPCLSDPARRPSLGLKVALVMLHLINVGVLFLFGRDLISKTKKEPWYTAIYLLLFAATLVQYFFTSGSSPGYVIDAMRAVNESHTISRKASMTSKQSASSQNGSLIIPVEDTQSGKVILGNDTISWAKLVMDMYPPGSSVRSSCHGSTGRLYHLMIFGMIILASRSIGLNWSILSWTCTYCNVIQPPRSKHCHDCDKCVLQFDHHCVWLGTCIGHGNHCRFWWYIAEETTLCIWTCILYITYLKANITRAWWKDAIMILLLATLSICLIFLVLLFLFHSYLVLTNQTTYELVRRRRIPYLRGIPERVYPFSKGICRNLYNFCCASSSIYSVEPLPTPEELEAKSRPYTCLDVLSCCCC